MLQTFETMVPKEFTFPQESHFGGGERLKSGGSLRRNEIPHSSDNLLGHLAEEARAETPER